MYKYDEFDFHIGCTYFNNCWNFRINSNKYNISNLDDAAQFFHMTAGEYHDIMIKDFGFFYNKEHNHMFHESYNGCYDVIKGWIKEFFDSMQVLDKLLVEEPEEPRLGHIILERHGIAIYNKDKAIATPIKPSFQIESPGIITFSGGTLK